MPAELTQSLSNSPYRYRRDDEYRSVCRLCKSRAVSFLMDRDGQGPGFTICWNCEEIHEIGAGAIKNLCEDVPCQDARKKTSPSSIPPAPPTATGG